MLQCVAVCCSVLQCVAVCCSVSQYDVTCLQTALISLECVSANIQGREGVKSGKVLQCIAGYYSVLQRECVTLFICDVKICDMSHSYV